MINTICVCGAGTMGSGIAQVAAHAGFSTILFDTKQTVVDNAHVNMKKSLEVLIGKGKMTEEDKKGLLSRLVFTSNPQLCKADIFIEAIIESQEAKTNLFNQLAQFNSDETIFASNTSSLSLNRIAEGIKNPERVIGMHFFNPAPVMKLVEVVKTNFTNEKTLSTTMQLAQKMGKVAVVCKDAPGFIVNRIARPFYIESLRLAEEGLVEMEELDQLLEASGFKMGPFKLMDLIGNDINYAVSCSVYEQLGRPERLKPSFIQEKKVAAGELGRKTGKGYYTYS
ncbi:MAG TPA: 3-hydroxyacyl-CoA dehydrogenase NAD-binding domain-containing protein [Chitinophagaceae bacterium]|nr:3-hydroxyacyl-CoA dehydrogenase NAD-binding domain-containing protein [Chitinophagaceae bacterium]HUM64334.1 3-hydroxyacyl-CoA dehydrogenase NAD-binding domain-containing protein [Chitinophagaceae bacterium]